MIYEVFGVNYEDFDVLIGDFDDFDEALDVAKFWEEVGETVEVRDEDGKVVYST